eukprot:4210651-Ditylum_brightwellii.AAC.1
MEVNNDFSDKPVNSSTFALYNSYIYGNYNITQRMKLNTKDDMGNSPSSWYSTTQYNCAHHCFSTTGSKLLAKHVSTANGGINVYLVNPAFVTSTDNITIHTNDSEDASSNDSISSAPWDIDDSSRNKKSKNYFVL